VIFKQSNALELFLFNADPPCMCLACPLQIEFYGDFDGSFHKSVDLTVDLSSALLGTRSTRYPSSEVGPINFLLY